MHVKRLAPGQRPPDEGWDFIEVSETPSGRFEVTGVVAYDNSAVLGRETYGTREEAEKAGLDWAKSHEAQIVYLVTINA